MATSENFILKLGTRDYVDKVICYTIFDVDRFSGGFSPNRWNITLLWLFSCPVLYCPFFFFTRQLEPRGRYSCFMAQMTWFRPRTVLLGLGRGVTFWGEMCPKNPSKRAWIGVFKPKSQNTTRRPASADRTARRQFQATGQPVSRTQASGAMTSRLRSVASSALRRTKGAQGTWDNQRSCSYSGLVCEGTRRYGVPHIFQAADKFYEGQLKTCGLTHC